jgi:hypothetical protein
VQAFLAINARWSMLILVIDLGRAAVMGLIYELLGEGVCGNLRDFEGVKMLCKSGVGSAR